MPSSVSFLFVQMKLYPVSLSNKRGHVDMISFPKKVDLVVLLFFIVKALLLLLMVRLESVHLPGKLAL